MSYPPAASIPAVKCACGHFARADEVTACRFCACTEHRPLAPGSPYGGQEPQNPVSSEKALQDYTDALEQAEALLAAARNAEVEAEEIRDEAKRRATLSEHCPRVARDAYTVAYRDAWVEQQIADEERAFRLARTARQAATTHLTVVSKQGSFQQSISKSVGGRERW